MLKAPFYGLNPIYPLNIQILTPTLQKSRMLQLRDGKGEAVL